MNSKKRIEEKLREQQKRMDQLQLDIQQNGLKFKNKETRQQKFKEILLQTRQEQRNLLEQTKRDKISENKNAFSQNMIWGATDNFTYSPGENRTCASYFIRLEDLYATDCVNWADSKKICLVFRNQGTTEHTKFVNNIFSVKQANWYFG